ncbi:catechol 2,3-dioxygenase [Pelagirhabdus alkalitolerans]|uniref:Catechol 2,3-dioxygenase n=1 Tax=Pelagirhabdus alkalitolerans TaxID=1612202 RepID=A0A1G6GNM0_9BACI|nr:VOC family protein [Pelagirhabdus alkalitolerans]SDB83591.1 catechol 2,3-dioxygenase [Pelagirhabdus alkalitolerans]
MPFHQTAATFVQDICLYVHDLDRSITFYCDVLGFRIFKQSAKKVELTADGKHVLITLLEDKDRKKRSMSSTGLYHVAFLVPTREALGRIIVQLIKNNHEVASADHLVSEAIYIDDPDGHGIEIYRDRDPSTWEWIDGLVKMTVEPLDFEGILNEVDQTQMFEGVEPETTLGHIHLHVRDLKESGAFYTKLLGFDVVSTLGHQALFLATENYHHHIGMNTWSGKMPPAPDTIQMEGFSIRYPSEEALERVLDQLEKSNVEIQSSVGRLYVEDPQGMKIYFKVM